MDAVTEGNVRIRIAPDIETIGVFKNFRIPVRGTDHRKHKFSSRDRFAMHFNFLTREWRITHWNGEAGIAALPQWPGTSAQASFEATRVDPGDPENKQWHC